MTNTPPTANLRGAIDLSPLLQQQNSAAQGAGATMTVPALIIEGSDANFGSILELSKSVPVVVELHAGSPSEVLGRVIESYSGRLLLATVAAQQNPQLVQAFRAVAAPTVAAVIAGQPVPMYEGDLPESEARSVLEQLLAVAAQHGVTGTATVEGAETDTEPEESAPEPLPPHHQEAYDAIDRGDYPSAIHEYETAIAQNPRDQLAVAGLAQVSLLHRLDGSDANDVRAEAAARPSDVDAQLAVADLDISGGHLDDAFDRLLSLFPSLDQDGKDSVRKRILSYFEIAGADDARVIAARRRLTGLLY